ncbi:cyclase family protein [Macrococcoides caseolyticum]|uniref:cyclase family protein n=1 Tax=Macrococcoides caseolyticum TaxID=69966 RepID=UPI001F359599|nr:cyclase family protein [Macrococcus caseolyticus]
MNQYKKVSLSHQVHAEIPYFPAFSPIEISNLTTVENDGFLGQQVSIGTQYGTHIDAPHHFVNGLRSLEEITIDERILPLYVIHKEREVEENPDYELTKQDIINFENEFGKVSENSFVAFSSGWSDKFSNKDLFYNKDNEGIEHTPGWSLDALKFLHEKRNVTAIGHETLNTDSGIYFAENNKLDAELYWLAQDKYQIELLNNLKEIPSVGSVIVIGVPQVIGLSGFNAEVFALVEKEI